MLTDPDAEAETTLIRALLDSMQAQLFDEPAELPTEADVRQAATNLWLRSEDAFKREGYEVRTALPMSKTWLRDARLRVMLPRLEPPPTDPTSPTQRINREIAGE